VPIAIRVERPDQPEVVRLLQARDDYLAALYPPESNHALDLPSLCHPSVTFLVARNRGEAIGCAAFVRGADGTGEVKSMWVDPARRGGGLGRRLLGELEHLARMHGVTVLRLETGTLQPEALALYRTAGYREIAPFGSYVPDPLSVFMEKPLAPGTR
jgi:putative acetyltransferase